MLHSVNRIACMRVRFEGQDCSDSPLRAAERLETGNKEYTHGAYVPYPPCNQAGPWWVAGHMANIEPRSDHH